MPLTRERKIELAQKMQFGTLTRDDKIELLKARNEAKKIKEETPLMEKEMPILGGKIGETYVRPLLQGTGAALGGVAGGVLGAAAGGVGAIPGSVAGAGLGYAGAEELYKLVGGRPSAGLAEDLGTAGMNVLEGAAMEAGGRAITPALSLARKTPTVIKSGIEAITSKPKVTTSIQQDVKSGRDVLRELSGLKTTPELEAINAKYKELGLPELTPAQVQPMVSGQPTPAQFAEGMVRARDPELYKKGAEQISKVEELLDLYRQGGASTPEVAGQQIKQTLAKKTKEIGQKVGEQVKQVKDISTFNKKVLPDLSEDIGGLLPNERNQVNNFVDMFKKTKNMRDVANLNSQMASITSQPEFKGTNFGRVINKLKTANKDIMIKAMEKEGIDNPRQVYEQYAIASGIMDDTLKGVYKTGQSSKVIGKITASGENIDQFRKVAQTVGEPELMTSVKANWLADVFQDKQFRNRWTKAKKEGITSKLLNNEEITRIDDILKYLQMAESTAAKTVNPPKTGIVNFFQQLTDNPAKTVVNYVMGDELKYTRAIRRYKAALNAKPGARDGQFIENPPIKTLPYMIGRDTQETD